MKGFIVVHVGAGYHAKSLRSEYKKACKNACTAAIDSLNCQKLATTAITAAVSALEDSFVTNAGTGSNLTLNGEVECDAGIMDGKSLNFGSVGALTNIKNPIQVAHKVLEAQNEGLLSYGRIPPSTLAAQGALEWAIENGFTKVENNALTTKSSRGIYLKSISLLNGTNSVNDCNLMACEEKTTNESTLLDTVGAICVDSFGNIASAVSSGGLLLKHSGRIGQAAIYGSGCWAQNSKSDSLPSVACSVTGVGEYIIKTMLANRCCSALEENFTSIFSLKDVFTKYFLESAYLKSVKGKLAGVLAVKHYYSENVCELSWIHNTKTMILGYMSTSDDKMSHVVSVQPNYAVNAETVIGSERRIRL